MSRVDYPWINSWFSCQPALWIDQWTLTPQFLVLLIGPSVLCKASVIAMVFQDFLKWALTDISWSLLPWSGMTGMFLPFQQWLADFLSLRHPTEMRLSQRGLPLYSQQSPLLLCGVSPTLTLRHSSCHDRYKAMARFPSAVNAGWIVSVLKLLGFRFRQRVERCWWRSDHFLTSPGRLGCGSSSRHGRLYR